MLRTVSMRSILEVLIAVATVLGIVKAFCEGYWVLASGLLGAGYVYLLARYLQPRWPGGPRLVKVSARQFLDRIDFANVKRILILGHTGKELCAEVRPKLEHLMSENLRLPEEICLLLRIPTAEEPDRWDLIEATMRTVRSLCGRGANVDVRFYENLPSVRGIICEFPNGERQSYISVYNWQHVAKRVAETSKSWAYGLMQKDSIHREKPAVRMLQSWIRHYWGKNEIHTVVFDFDDTLALTGHLQIKAWIEAIQEAVTQKKIARRDCCEELCSALEQGQDLEPVVKKVFLDKQLAEDIAGTLFPKVDKEIVEEIDSRRFDIRKELMKQATLFDGVETTVKRVSRHYNLAIVSSTEENIITPFLEAKALRRYFSHVLGKSDPSLKGTWQHVYHKSVLMMKLSELLGVPLDRFVFVGDNNSDYLAAQQRGVDFVEARQAAQEMGKQSLITTELTARQPYDSFSSFEGMALDDILTALDKQKWSKKWPQTTSSQRGWAPLAQPPRSHSLRGGASP